MATPGNYEACSMCGRHLLRGEEPEVFLNDGERREVCELCAPQALFAGWIRVGVNDAPTLEPSRLRGARSILDRLRRRRDPSERPEPAAAPSRPSLSRHPGSDGEPDLAAPSRNDRRHHRVEDEVEGLALAEEQPAAPLAAYATTATGAPAHVATSGARMTARAVDLYNHSQHPRVLAGIARSLGPPWVTIRALEGSTMRIVIAWELTWYRFELDLARESAGVRDAGRGTSLSELAAGDVEPNAVADAHGYLYLKTDASSAA